jgi:hypothetical protein
MINQARKAADVDNGVLEDARVREQNQTRRLTICETLRRIFDRRQRTEHPFESLLDIA